MIFSKPVFQLWPEVPDKTLDWPSSAVSQSADGVALNLFAQFPNHINLLWLCVALSEPPHHCVHPVITRGKKALEITSEIPYRQEYHDEKYLIYYPQHITEGYESNAKLKKAMGEYKADYEDHKAKNYYKYSDTELYANQQKGAQLLDRVYKADYEATKMINQPASLYSFLLWKGCKAF